MLHSQKGLPGKGCAHISTGENATYRISIAEKSSYQRHFGKPDFRSNLECQRPFQHFYHGPTQKQVVSIFRPVCFYSAARSVRICRIKHRRGAFKNERISFQTDSTLKS